MSLRRCALSRADLLRALELAAGDEARAQALAGVLAFVPRPQTLDRVVGAGEDQRITTTTGNETLSPVTGEMAAQDVDVLVAELVVPGAWTMASEPDPSADQRRTVDETEVFDPPLSASDVVLSPPVHHLLRPAQWWPALRSSLTVERQGPPDWSTLVRQMSQRRMPRRLPRTARRVWGGELWVVADVGDRLRPYREDLQSMLRLLLKLRGSHGFRVRAVQGHPDAWLPDLGGPVPRKAAAGTVIVVLSDLGALAPDASLEAAWLRRVTAWKQQGALPVCWAPLAPAQVPRALAQALAVHCMLPGAPQKRQAGRWSAPEQREAEHRRLAELRGQLEALVSCNIHLEPGLLRGLRLLVPALAREPALEALYWGDTSRVSNSLVSRPLRPAAAAQARYRLATVPAPVREAVLATQLAWHAGRARSTVAFETSLWLTHADTRNEAELPSELASAVRSHEAWLTKLADLCLQAPADRPLAPFARDLMSRQAEDTKWMQRQRDTVAALWATTGEDVAPPGLDAAAWMRATRLRAGTTDASAPTWQLIEYRGGLWAWPQAVALPRLASPVAPGLRGSTLVIDQGSGGLLARRPDAQGGELARLPDNPFEWTVSTENASLTVARQRRPYWATGWGRDREGVFAAVRTPWGEELTLRGVPDADGLLYSTFPAFRPSGVSAEDTERAAPEPAAERLRASSRATRLSGVPTWLHVLVPRDQEVWVPVFQTALSPLEDSVPDLEVKVWREDPKTLPQLSRQMTEQLEAGHPVIVLPVHSQQFEMSPFMKLPMMAEAASQRSGALNLHVWRIHMGGAQSQADDAHWRTLPWAPSKAWGDRMVGPQIRREADNLRAVVADLVTSVRRELGSSAQGSIAARASTWQFGADPRFGLYADMRLGTVTQRLRYIPPGTFWMGSPDDEPERSDDEGPSHPVRITQGFWLADTACTQSLWLAMMGGKNASRFADDPRNPVEQVNWDDVQAFLHRLQAMLPPGCTAALPTEAEWEYACRAGTDDPFSWGRHIDSTQVNFDGTMPYDGGPPSEYRERTVPAGGLLPNPWGLYQMHGNVWEWCEDSGTRRYEASDEPIDDPRDAGGDGDSPFRALRGGSWFRDARSCRSASRRAVVRGFRIDGDVGFRLALRSSGSSPAPAQVFGAPEAPRSPGRDGPGTAARRDAEPFPSKTPGLKTSRPKTAVKRK